MLKDLLIFAKIYELLKWLHQELARFPKSEKPVLGKRIYESTINILDSIIVANEEKDKISFLKQASVELEKLRIFLRLAKDFRLISIGKYGFVSKEVNEIGKMLGGWIKKAARG
ncbi:MAG: diversity-generating retroelement protein Avd [Candidatus Omnitrophica bacterium]|nr:diversity-generating retroelement protein Avd [Candidatus Omnitrophota bacterium]